MRGKHSVPRPLVGKDGETLKFWNKAPAGVGCLPKLSERQGMKTQCLTKNGGRLRAAPAFTMRDLLACLAVCVLVAAIAIPALANSKLRSDRAVCIANLGSIGRAFNQWAAEHRGLYPVHVESGNGGTRNHPSGLNNNLFFQMAWLSNELVTPRVLACPADPRVRVAQDFTSSYPGGGFLHPSYRNNAVSYFLGWPQPSEGRRLLSGDNALPVVLGVGSETGISPTYQVDRSDLNLHWAPGFYHQEVGNLLFNDGSVEQADSPRLRDIFRGYPESPDTGNQVHFLVPRLPAP